MVKWVSIKLLPFNFFDDDLTQNFFKILNKEISVPKKDLLRNKVLSQYEVGKKIYCIFKKIITKISFTIDGWTSVKNKSFYGITAHFIDENWRLQSVVIDFVASNGKHTGKDIAKIFFESISFYQIENKIQGITVDKRRPIQNLWKNCKF